MKNTTSVVFLLLLLLCFTAMIGCDTTQQSQETLGHARSAPESVPIQPGDWAVTGEATVLAVGRKVVATVGPDTCLRVRSVKGQWVSVRVSRGGKNVVGWIKSRKLRPATAREKRQGELLEEYEEYLPKLLVQNVRVEKASPDLSGYRVTGEVKNTGDRSVWGVALVLHGLDAEDHPLFETSFYLCPSDQDMPSLAKLIAKPLKPNYSVAFGLSSNPMLGVAETLPASPPSEWTREVRIEVVGFRFWHLDSRERGLKPRRVAGE